MRKKQEQPKYFCPNHSKQMLRPSYAYPNMLWCDLCTNAWLPHELHVSKNKQFLIKNITDRVRNPDHICLFLDISQKEIDTLIKIKKDREEMLSKYSKNIQDFKFNINPFLNVQCLRKIKLLNENKEQEEELSEKIRSKSLINLANINLDIKKCRPDSVTATRCEMTICSSGISFENKTYSDYEHIESALILWKDLGIV